MTQKQKIQKLSNCLADLTGKVCEMELEQRKRLGTPPYTRDSFFDSLLEELESVQGGE